MIIETNKTKEPPQIAIKFANIIFTLGIAYSILLIIYSVYKIFNPAESTSPIFYIICFLFGSVSTLLFSFGLKILRKKLKVSFSVFFFALGITVYGFETYLDFLNKDNYNIYFGEDRFANKKYFGGTYEKNKNDNNYTIFSSNEINFIVINIGWEPNANELKWAANLLKTYNEHRAIVVSHYILDDDFSIQGQNIYNALKNNSNLFLMLSGHVGFENMQTDIYNNDYQVYSLLADYSDRQNGGNGWLRLLKFSPHNNEIQVKTYSPLLDKWEADKNSEFTLSYNMNDLVLSSLEDQTTNSSDIKEDFSIIVLPDTQVYSEKFPSIFNLQTQWIVDNYKTLNIVYVAHTGDIVNNNSSKAEWRNASRAMKTLEDAVSEQFPDGIPYGVIPGNHDLPIIYTTRERIINLLKLTKLRILIYPILFPKTT